ncbi:Nucleotidylyl transferase [Clavulina sp. PMI_390]|nr:Nucleotidylyl transferase [Clavulina sp. PMI_390]
MYGLQPALRRLASKQHARLTRSTHSASKVVFSGIQPTGTPHLGNFLGALSNWTRLQSSAADGDTLIYSVVGLHAITVPQDPSQLRTDRLNAVASLLAIGLDPARSIIFCQEDVQEHAELAWMLGCFAPMGRLSRMTAYKSKVATMASTANDEKLGLFAYPVLQAADILLYKATHVPVGEDQRQHLELTRDIAQWFNQRYMSQTFALPSTISTPTKRILSLRDPIQKMSKSAKDPKSRILLSDSRDEIARKIRKAVTDSETTISYDPIHRPGISNLLRILHE